VEPARPEPEEVAHRQAHGHGAQPDPPPDGQPGDGHGGLHGQADHRRVPTGDPGQGEHDPVERGDADRRGDGQRRAQHHHGGPRREHGPPHRDTIQVGQERLHGTDPETGHHRDQDGADPERGAQGRGHHDQDQADRDGRGAQRQAQASVDAVLDGEQRSVADRGRDGEQVAE
jgi:hypothetical protein